MKMRELIAIVLAALLVSGAVADDTPKTPDEAVKALREGLKVLVAAERAQTSYRCQTKIAVHGTVQGKAVTSVSNTVCRVSRAGDALAVHVEKRDSGPSSPPNQGEDKTVLNNDYMFALRRSGPEAPWTLTKFSRANRQADFWQVVSVLRTAIHPLTADTISTLLPDTLDNPTFRISSVKTRMDGLVEVVCSVETGNAANTVSQSGTLTLSPRQGYAVVGYDRTLTVNGEKYREQCTRVLSEPSQPLSCKSVQFTYTNLKTGSASQRQQFDFTEVSADPVPADQFTLPAYGIPEPVDIDALPVPVYQGWKFWTVVAIVCLTLMLFFRWLTRRISRRQTRLSRG